MSFPNNGILAKVRGEFIAQGSQTLPRAQAGQPEHLQAEIDVPDVGRVRITYRLASSSHHKSRNWFWSAIHAELAE